jgi:hypothetical protein
MFWPLGRYPKSIRNLLDNLLDVNKLLHNHSPGVTESSEFPGANVGCEQAPILDEPDL